MRIRYIKFEGNIKEYEYFYKFEIKYYGKIVLTDPFNYTVVVVHDLARQDSVLRRATKGKPKKIGPADRTP